MERTARCACGQLSATVEGEPELVAVCSCRHCQRRTGSVLGVSAYFPGAAVTRISGESRQFVRSSDAGRELRFHFCPDCGTSVYWEADFLPGRIGVGVGLFGDDAFPPPQVAVWKRHLPDWIALPAGMRCFEAGSGR